VFLILESSAGLRPFTVKLNCDGITGSSIENYFGKGY
jgi:hypothetical protein